jgi:outer membrane biogenesis lipoprotein LolB
MNHRSVLLPCAVLLLTACSVPFRTSSDEKKAACDRIAARAIQTTSLQQAKDLAAQAAECYARAQQ